MQSYQRLLLNNQAWVADKMSLRPDFFTQYSAGQKPEFLWIGCSDSRVPAEVVTGVEPGELFVHRNVANMVVHTDFNMLSVVQYAVEVLQVKHVIVCGHYGCGGVKAALEGAKIGLIDNWLRHIRDVHHQHVGIMTDLPQEQRFDALCELNVIEQANNVCQTSFVQDAWARGQKIGVHAWVYGLKDGLINDLGFHVSRPEEFTPAYGAALKKVRTRGNSPKQ
jgi:carbonic anhydrase